jgi:hypothetical protein
MKNKLLIILAVLIVPLMACSDSGSPATSSIITDIAGIKAKEPIWDSYGPRLTAVEARPSSSGSTFDPSSLNNKDSDLQNQINNMKSDYQGKIDALTTKVNNLTPPTTPGGVPSSPSGSVTVLTNPTNVQILGGGQLCYTIKIQNTMSNWVYVRPIITINAGTGQSPTRVTAIAITMGGSAGNLATTNFQFTPILPTGSTVSSITAIPTSGGSTSNGEFQIAAGAVTDLLVCIQITSDNPIIWNIGTAVNSRTL